MKRALFSDNDGTLSKGLSYPAFLACLFQGGVISPRDIWNQINLIYDYKMGFIEYEGMIRAYAGRLAESLQGKDQTEVKDIARFSCQAAKGFVYSSSYEIMEEAKEAGLESVLVSAAPQEIISEVAKDFGIDCGFGTRCGVMEGVYTGELVSKLHLREGKARVVKDYALERDIDLSESIALGDTLQDVDMLELVGNPIALNPDKRLKKYAKEKGWKICTHKTIVETLREFYG